MIEKRYNIFEAATQLVSLDCSSITGETASICHHTSHSLQQSILNLKTVLPTFTSEFNLFKQEIIEMSYFIVNKLMSVIKTKSLTISQLQNDLQKSQSLNTSMKKQVIQLQDMIMEFMQSHKKQMQQKEKEINQKQKQVQQLKNVLKQNFNSPRNLCKNCQQKINHTDNKSCISETIEEKKQPESYDLKLNNFFKNFREGQEILIQMSESIVCNAQEINTRKSLEIIQEQNSQVNSLTDYLQSQRCSQKENTSKSIGQIIKSTRSGEDKQNQKESFYTGKRSLLDAKNPNADHPQNLHYLSDCYKTVKDYHSPVGKINFFQNLENKNFNDAFSSRVTNKICHSNENIKPQNEKEKQRRNSQIILAEKAMYQGFKIQRKSQERTVLGNKNLQNHMVPPHQQVKQQLSLKAQLQQISKSSSCSDFNHFGDSQKINVNLPKKFQSPKNMNFIQKNTSHKQERLRTEPSPRNCKYELNKENIHIEYQPKSNEMGRKIIARKKMIMTHAKASTSRIEAKKPLKQQAAQLIRQPKVDDFIKKKDSFIEIKFIDSPQKQPSRSSHLLKPSVSTMFSSNNPLFEIVSRTNTYMEYSSVASNISAINESAVKSHHLYHSTDKYQSAETPKNIHKITMTPGKPQSKAGDRKSISKSKQKLKVMSKSVNQDQSILYSNNQQSKERFLNEMNSNFFSSCNNQSISKLKSKNLSVHIGNNTNNKLHIKQNLTQIKNALTNYNVAKIFTALKEVYFDGKLVNGAKEGHGKIVYDNGIIYEGLLKGGKKEGEGKLSVNGVDIFEGNFANDCIEGQGYLKFFKYFVNSCYSCPKVLQNASYYGRFSNSGFDGMGTLFLNQKEKIVTKFSKGVPFGQLTFYTQNDIEFGHWPTE